VDGATSATITDLGRQNQLELYESLGARRFEYDANGNRVTEIDLDHGVSRRIRYSYDARNRLAGVSIESPEGHVVKSIEYSYDPLDRQVGKRVTAGGHTTEYTRVWIGSQLLGELQDGRLLHTFAYSQRGRPLKLTKHDAEGTKGYYYTL